MLSIILSIYFVLSFLHNIGAFVFFSDFFLSLSPLLLIFDDFYLFFLFVLVRLGNNSYKDENLLLYVTSVRTRAMHE